MRPFFLSIIALLSWAQCEANNRFGTPSGQCEPCVECFDDNLLTWTIYPTQYNFVKVDSSIVYNNRHPLKSSRCMIYLPSRVIFSSEFYFRKFLLTLFRYKSALNQKTLVTPNCWLIGYQTMKKYFSRIP